MRVRLSATWLSTTLLQRTQRSFLTYCFLTGLCTGVVLLALSAAEIRVGNVYDHPSPGILRRVEFPKNSPVDDIKKHVKECVLPLPRQVDEEVPKKNNRNTSETSEYVDRSKHGQRPVSLSQEDVSHDQDKGCLIHPYPAVNLTQVAEKYSPNSSLSR
jgi:hypothetical protein